LPLARCDAPSVDVQNMTAFLAAQVIYESLVLLCRMPSDMP
jgi:hypothetical protein